MTLDPNGNLTVTGRLGVTGQSTLTGGWRTGTGTNLSYIDSTGNLNVTGTTTVGGTLRVTGQSTLAGLSAGRTDVNGNLEVTGTTKLVGAVVIQDKIEAGRVGQTNLLIGNTTIPNLNTTGGNLIIGNNSSINTINGTTTLHNTTVGGTLTVNGDTTLQQLTAGNVNARNTINGTTILRNTTVGDTALTVSGDTTLFGNLKIKNLNLNVPTFRIKSGRWGNTCNNSVGSFTSTNNNIYLTGYSNNTIGLGDGQGDNAKWYWNGHILVNKMYNTVLCVIPSNPINGAVGILKLVDSNIYLNNANTSNPAGTLTNATTYSQGTLVNGTELSNILSQTFEQCELQCAITASCSGFTYNSVNRICHLKSGTITTEPGDNKFSGKALNQIGQIFWSLQNGVLHNSWINGVVWVTDNATTPIAVYSNIGCQFNVNWIYA